MRQNFGGLAAILAVLGFWLHMQSPSTGNSPSLTSAGAGKKSKAAQEPESPIIAQEGPWIATQAFFPPNPRVQVYDPEQLFHPALDDLNAGKLRAFLGLPEKAPPEVWSVVATVADPLHTRLSLFLDSQLEIH